MSSSEKYLTQALEWIAEENADLDTELCIDLPDMGWIRAHSLKEADGSITCEYTSGLMSRRSPQILVCPVEKITAIRRTENLLSVIKARRGE